MEIKVKDQLVGTVDGTKFVVIGINEKDNMVCLVTDKSKKLFASRELLNWLLKSGGLVNKGVE